MLWLRRRQRHAAKAIDVLAPVTSEKRIDNAVVPRGVIETILIRDNSDVRQSVEENQRAELQLFVGRRRLKPRPERARAGPLEIDSGRAEGTPNKSRTIEPVWTSRAPVVGRTQSLIDRRRK